MSCADQPLVSVILINYNTYDLTLDCLRSFRISSYSNFELIVIDNASSQDMSANFRELSFPYTVHWYRSEKNLGFAGANNLGMQKSQGEYFFFINNDTEITKDLLGQLVETLSENDQIGLISPKILFHGTNTIQYAGSTQLSFLMRNASVHFGVKDTPDIKSIERTHYAHGAAMMTKKIIVEECGQMPEAYFLYYEELDWCEMIKRGGYQIWVDQRAIIYHKESMSIGKSNPLKTYYLTRNRLLFKRRNYTNLEVALFFLYYLALIPIRLVVHLFKKERGHALAVFRGFVWHLGIR